MIGLGIDFGIHLLFRYEEEFLKCGHTDDALDRALLGTGSDITLGAISTAVAFWAVGFTNFTGISELGTIAGSGVILCLISTLIVLPALISRMDQTRKFIPGDAIPTGSRILLARAENRFLQCSRWVLIGVSTLFLLMLPVVSTVKFDYNLLNLQDPSLESVKTELELIRRGGNTVLFSVSVADSLEHANSLKTQFEALPTVGRAESVSDLFPPRTPGKVDLLNELHFHLSKIPVSEPQNQRVRPPTGRDLEKLGDEFQAFSTLFETQKGELAKHQSPRVRQSAIQLESLLDSLFVEMSSAGPGPVEDGLLVFQEDFRIDILEILTFLQHQSADSMTVLELPENVRVRSVGQTGKLAVRIYPKENIWERPALEDFVADVQSVDAEVLGDPVTILHYTKELRTAFEMSGACALLAVTVMLLLYFRSLQWVLLALTPLATGVYVMLFVMGCYRIPFNPANFMGLPLLLGIGLDFAIHILHRSKEEGQATIFGNSTGPATAISALTTICGFGTLAFGGHKGVASLGFILATGVTGILLSSLLLLPAILNVWSPFPNRSEDSDRKASEARQKSA